MNWNPKKHNKTYLGGWSKYMNKKNAKACILISISENDDMHLNTLDIQKDVLIQQLEQAIEVLKGNSDAHKTVEEIKEK